MDVGLLSQKGKKLPNSGAEIRSAFLNFYAERGHEIIPSASLVPDDPTVLLTIAGMLPFKPIFLGHKKRPVLRATSSQKCIRTNDIENVGRTARHHTFFEMLGNFSFGDYFKKDAIQWAWELSTTVFGLDSNRLIISIFRDDDETNDIWQDVVGLDPKRIIRMDEADNFWSSGLTGPCGPCSELYYDFKPELGLNKIDLEDDSRFIEFYNLVFMQYNRDKEGSLTPLDNCNIDTGMGLERMAQILQKVPNNYETDLIYPLILEVSLLAGIDYQSLKEKDKISVKIIADHIRAVTQLIADGVSPNNLGRGYVLRRLLRRMIRYGRLLGINKFFLKTLGDSSILLMKEAYPQLIDKRSLILAELENEEIRFLKTLDRGEKLLEDILNTSSGKISGKQAFDLYDTYGFPVELTQEIAQEKGFSIDIIGFENEMSKQRDRAKAAAVNIDLTIRNSIEKIASEFEPTHFKGFDSLTYKSNVLSIVVKGEKVQSAITGDRIQLILDKTPFFGESGGQIGDNGVITSDNLFLIIDGVQKEKDVFIHSGFVKNGKITVNDLVDTNVDIALRRRAQSNHTATHLLQSALKKLIDPSIGQRGSLVAFDRLRFDFNSPKPLSSDQLGDIESLINQWIAENHPIVVKTMPIDQALSDGAIAMFGEKYSDIVRVVDVPGVSMELCGGTHVHNTAELGAFKIINELGIASGIRRIEAIAGQSILDYLNEKDHVVKELSKKFKAQPVEILPRVTALQDELKELTTNHKTLCDEIALLKVLALKKKVISVGSYQFLVSRLDHIDGQALQLAAQRLIDSLGENSAVILGGIPEVNTPNKVVIVAAFAPKIIANGLQAGKFIGPIAMICGGGGGGKPGLAQAGGNDASQLDEALNFASQKLLSALS